MNMLAMLAARLGLPWLMPGAGLIATAGSIVSAAISFFSTPIGKWVGIALIGATLYVAGDIHRGRLDRARYDAKWAAAIRAAEMERAARDETIRRAMAADADRRIASIERESEQLQIKVTDYENALSAANAAACRVSAGDARRLRELGYAPASGPGRGPGGMRAPPAAGRASGGADR